MGRYDALKHPYPYRMTTWAGKKTNDHQETQAKSIPCHVTKVDKDFIEVAFETANSIFTPPTVKIPQSWSGYSREPTQVGDKGYAVPGNYYLGGVTGDAGGNTDFYPRGNLTTLSFNGVSHKQNPQRDYDQLTHMGGPKGWIVWPYIKPQDQQQQNGGSGGGGSTGLAMMKQATRSTMFRTEQAKLRSGGNGVTTLDATTSGTSDLSSNGQQQQQQQQDPTQFSFDENGKCLMQSKDTSHNMVCDQQNKTCSITSGKTIFTDPSGGIHYVGGNPKNTFGRIMTDKGPSPFGYARVS